MLINTVLLFLQNSLPIFIITTLLLLSFSSKTMNRLNIKWLIFGFIITFISAFILSYNLERISLSIEGKGTEVLFAFGLLVIYFASIALFILNNKSVDTLTKKRIAFIVFFIISCLNGADFIIYLTSYWANAQQVDSMLIGIVLGGGICLSIAILLYFLLIYVNQKIHLKMFNYFLLLFAVGQLMKAIVLLQQVDSLPSSSPVWDSSHLISENSELGQLLMALFGYEATPSYIQLVTYAVAFVIPVLMSKTKAILLYIHGGKS